MHASAERVQMIVTDDDKDDYSLIESAFEAVGLRGKLIWLKNGEELIDWLRRRGSSAALPLPPSHLIILDLNMPGMDGRQTLSLIKADPALRRIPVIVMTTSGSEEDVARSYEQGACSFIRKPAAFDGYVQIAKQIKRYWLELVELPEAEHAP